MLILLLILVSSRGTIALIPLMRHCPEMKELKKEGGKNESREETEQNRRSRERKNRTEGNEKKEGRIRKEIKESHVYSTLNIMPPYNWL